MLTQSLTTRPELLWLHHSNPERYPFLLESCVQGTPQARFDILFAFPQQRLWLDRELELHADPGVPLANGFLASLDQWRQQQDSPGRSAGLPFYGGWFLYLGYELVGEIEPTVRLPSAGLDFPVAFAVRCPAALVWDHDAQRGWAISETGDRAQLQQLTQDATLSGVVPALPELGEIGEEEPGKFAENLAAIHEYILAGDVFQVNVSRKWQVSERADPAGVYAALRRSNPAPFAGIARWQDAAVVSSSPERLVQVEGDLVQTRPIAGTRPREDRAADHQRRAELIGHPKERAEHIMLIDLERNDLGRVCHAGSVEVDELMVVESYAHVHHIVSNVRGRLRPGVSSSDVIRAVFPGGTITGCPKVRCMQIIAELEAEGRGPYTGSMGYLNCDGNMDLNILIRTVLVERDRITLRAGAGIVADSKIGRELNETRSKAKGMLLALASGGSGSAMVNGKISDSISIDDRGLNYGDGVFETLLCRSGTMALWRYHWARLQRASEVLQLALPNEKILRGQIHELVGAQGDWIIKIIITRGASGRGYRPPPAERPNVIVRRFPWRKAATVDGGLRVGVCETRLARQPLLAGLKHLNRLEQVLVQLELKANDWDDGLVCDQQGLLIEASQANLFLLTGQQLYTPRLDCCGVAGAYRAMLLDRFATEQVALTADQLGEFQAAFVCNSVRGIMPIREVVGHTRFSLDPVRELIAKVGEC